MERIETAQRRYEKFARSWYTKLSKKLSTGKLGVIVPLFAGPFLVLSVLLTIFGSGGYFSVIVSCAAIVLCLAGILPRYETLCRNKARDNYADIADAIIDRAGYHPSYAALGYRGMRVRLDLSQVKFSPFMLSQKRLHEDPVRADEVGFISALCRTYDGIADDYPRDDYIEEGVALLLAAWALCFRADTNAYEDQRRALLLAVNKYGEDLILEAQRQYLYAVEDSGSFSLEWGNDSAKDNGVEAIVELCVQLADASQEKGFDEFPAEAAFLLAAARDTAGRIRSGQC